MVFSVSEIIDMIIMTVIVGYVFSDFLAQYQPKKQTENYDPLAQYLKPKQDFWQKFLFAVSVGAPAIILHEFGHKFVAIFFGATASFQAAYGFLLLAIILKIFKSPFIFFVPAYVAFSGNLNSTEVGLIALAGPVVNVLLWAISKYIVYLLTTHKKLGRKYGKYIPYFVVSAKINGFLAIFNMIPIPGFDGYHVFTQFFLR